MKISPEVLEECLEYVQGVLLSVENTPTENIPETGHRKKFTLKKLSKKERIFGALEQVLLTTLQAATDAGDDVDKILNMTDDQIKALCVVSGECPECCGLKTKATILEALNKHLGEKLKLGADCGWCRGEGCISDDPEVPGALVECPQCSGTGRLISSSAQSSDAGEEVLPCPVNVGAGKFGEGIKISTLQGAIDRAIKYRDEDIAALKSAQPKVEEIDTETLQEILDDAVNNAEGDYSKCAWYLAESFKEKFPHGLVVREKGE